MPKLTQDRLKDLLQYNLDTGIFYWLKKTNNTEFGQIAGTLNELGYIQISIDSIIYLAHNIAWLYVENEWPPDEGFQVDHKDLNRQNNKWSNFRLATRSENQINRNIQSNNTSGITGISWNKNRNSWEAYIKLNNKKLNLGRFKEKEIAIQVRQAAIKKYFGEYAPCQN